MRYIKVRWIHSNPDYPILLYSELDNDRWEVRKVEFFPDGSVGFAGPHEHSRSTQLGLVPVPSLDDIASDSQFVPVEITEAEFAQVWANRR